MEEYRWPDRSRVTSLLDSGLQTREKQKDDVAAQGLIEILGIEGLPQ